MAINWSDNPASAPTLPHLPLERVKPASQIHGVITCNTYLGVWTHFIGGRTLPCTAPTCPGCEAQRRKGWEAYLSIWTNKPSRHIIAALTPGAALQLTDAAPDPGQLRGNWITIRRHGSRPNGKLLVELQLVEVNVGCLPPPPDLKAHMYKIWGLDVDEMPDDHPLFAVREQLIDDALSTNGARPRPR